MPGNLGSPILQSPQTEFNFSLSLCTSLLGPPSPSLFLFPQTYTSLSSPSLFPLSQTYTYFLQPILRKSSSKLNLGSPAGDNVVAHKATVDSRTSLVRWGLDGEWGVQP